MEQAKFIAKLNEIKGLVKPETPAKPEESEEPEEKDETEEEQ